MRWSDYNLVFPSKFSIEDGGIGKSFVKIKLSTESGMQIRSIIDFHYNYSNIPTDPVNLDNFYEANIDLDI